MSPSTKSQWDIVTREGKSVNKTLYLTTQLHNTLTVIAINALSKKLLPVICDNIQIDRKTLTQINLLDTDYIKVSMYMFSLPAHM